MRDTRIPRFRLEQDYPFCKFNFEDDIYPNKQELEEIKKFTRFFDNTTIQYKILSNTKIITQVKRLKDGKIYNVGDVVYYYVNNNNYVTFKISGFIEAKDGRIDICWNSKRYDNDLARACGIGILHSRKRGIKYAKLT